MDEHKKLTWKVLLSRAPFARNPRAIVTMSSEGWSNITRRGVSVTRYEDGSLARFDVPNSVRKHFTVAEAAKLLGLDRPNN